MDALPPLAVNHVNLRARDPDALGRWYEAVLGFQRRGPFLWSAGTLLVFSRGDPFPSGDLHIGCRLGSRAELDGWVALALAGARAAPAKRPKGPPKPRPLFGPGRARARATR